MSEKSDYKLFLITEDEISPIEMATPENILLVLSQKLKKIYLYRGNYSENFDEFESGELYDRVVNRFLNPQIFLVKTLEPKTGDTEESTAIKAFLKQKIDNSTKFWFRRLLRNIVFLESYRKKVKIYNNFQTSKVWRSRVSNFTGMRRLSILNTVFGGIGLAWLLYILLAKIVPTINNPDLLNSQSTLNKWLESITIGAIGIVFLSGTVFLLNLIFVLFPLRFPIKPYQFSLNESRKMTEKIAPQDTALSQKGPAPASETGMETETVKSPPGISKLPPKLPKLPSIPARNASKIPGIKRPKNVPKKKAATHDHKNTEMDEELDIPMPPLRKISPSKIAKSRADSPDSTKTPKSPPKKGKLRRILADCPICDKILHMEIPENFVSDAEEPVVELTYLHGTPQHSLVVQLDHDFQVRRRRASWVVEDPKA
ncbi:hypothetical protein ES708_08999 [subsurface metagenome]